MLKSSPFAPIFLLLVATSTLMMNSSAQAPAQTSPVSMAPVATKSPVAPAASTAFQFDFGQSKPNDGYTHSMGEPYSDERGYGFDFGSQPKSAASVVPAGLSGGCVTSEEPYFFSVKVPEGNYRITVTLGHPTIASNVTIRTEAGQLMATNIGVPAGKTETRTFIANVRRPQLPAPPPNAPGGTIVHMFIPGEAQSRIWDDRLTIEFNGTNPSLHSLAIVKDDAVPTLFMAGDSTVADPRSGPGGNWPTQIRQFLKPGIAVCNSASSGETSKSFITGQRMDKVLSQMKAGDFFMVQFGHNDSKPQWPQTYTEPGTTFNAYLRVFLAETRRRGATLILVTPMERRDNGDSLGPWARAMRQVAAEEKIPLIDQWAASKEMWAAMGPNVGSAFSDQTHLSGYGGYLLSKLMVAGIQNNVPELAKFVLDNFQPMETAHPEPPPAYLQQLAGPRAAR